MILQNYLDDQRELNAHLDVVPTAAQVKIAASTEVGEFQQELKSLWFWWPRPDKEYVVDRERVLAEAMDVLHFLCLGELEHPGEHDPGNQGWIDLFGTNRLAEIHDYLDGLVASVGSGWYVVSIAFLFGALRWLDFTEEEIEAAWARSVAKNLSRWQPER